jgi:hypothetical protein
VIGPAARSTVLISSSVTGDEFPATAIAERFFPKTDPEDGISTLTDGVFVSYANKTTILIDVRNLKSKYVECKKEATTYKSCLHLFGHCAIRNTITPWFSLLSGFGCRSDVLSKPCCRLSRFVIVWFTFGLNNLFWSKYWRRWVIFLLDETTRNLNSIPQDLLCYSYASSKGNGDRYICVFVIFIRLQPSSSA